MTGSTGVFLPRFTNKEAGVREVLFNDKTLFQGNHITNFAIRTVFVHVAERNPATLAVAPVTKNLWSGRKSP